MVGDDELICPAVERPVTPHPDPETRADQALKQDRRPAPRAPAASLGNPPRQTKSRKERREDADKTNKPNDRRGVEPGASDGRGGERAHPTPLRMTTAVAREPSFRR